MGGVAPASQTEAGSGDEQAGKAAGLAVELLEGVGSRLEHTRRVADQAGRVCRLLGGPWGAALVPAAWLHDLGYSPAVAVTGFHPLDGARYLRRSGWPPEVCRLVAWHSAAAAEAELRGLALTLADEFTPPPPEAAAAMAWADLTSSPAGELWSVQDRLAEILERYPPGTLVHRAVSAAAPELVAAAAAVEAGCGICQPI